MGLAALSANEAVSKASEYREKAKSLLDLIIVLSHDPQSLGRPNCEGAPESSPMNVPMILLNVIDELRHAGVIN
jgi:hypothetical protein